MKFNKILYEGLLIERTINTPNGPLLGADGQPLNAPEVENNKPKKQSSSKDPLAGTMLTKKQQQDFEKDPTNIVDMLNNGEIKYFEDFRNWNKALKQKVIDSIRDKGVIYKDNPFLRYAKYISGTPVTTSSNLTPAILGVIEKAAEKDDRSFIYTNKNLKNNKYNLWIEDPESYTADDPLYKVKALLFLTSGDVSKFGDTKTVPIEAVKKSKKKDEILNIISKWQTKNDTKPINTGTDNKKGSSNDREDKSAKVGKKSEAIKKFINAIGGDRGAITIKKSDLLKFFESGNIKPDDTLNNAYAKLFKRYIIDPNKPQQSQQAPQQQNQQQQNNR